MQQDSTSFERTNGGRGTSARPQLTDAQQVERLRFDTHEQAALLNDSNRAIEAVADRATDALLGQDILVIELGTLACPLERSRQIAQQLARAMLSPLHRAGLPPSLRIEVDVAQETFVPSGFETRMLVPHQDGGHVSYLTPSLLDDAGWDPGMRRFAPYGHCEYSTQTQKIYQGLFIAEQGSTAATIAFYPVLDMLLDAFKDAHGHEPSLPELIAWYGGNLRKSFDSRARHGGHYPTLAAFTGSERDEYLGVAPHCAEAPLEAELLERFPKLDELAHRCACGTCTGPAGRVFCNMLADVLGRHWLSFQSRYQSHALQTQPRDLVLWNNLACLHAGFDGSRTRVLEPIGFVVDEPSGESYEAWLRSAWRDLFARSSKATSRRSEAAETSQRH